MKTIILTVGLLFTITLVSGQTLDRDCNSDQECGGNNIVCKDRKCICGVGYKLGNQQNCVPVLGTTCDSNDDCENMPGAECESYRCTCRAGWVPGTTECTKIGREGEECTTNSDCIHRNAPPDQNKECKNNKCTCISGLHEGDDKRCKQNIGLHEVCMSDECFLADNNNNNALECTNASDGQGKECRCKTGYVEEGDTCNGSAAVFMLSASSVLLVVMAVLRM